MILVIKIFIIFVMCTTRSISFILNVAIIETVLTHGDLIKKNIKKDLIDISTEDAELYKIIPGSILCKNCKSRFDRGDRLDDSNSSIEQDVTVEDSETPSIQENNDAASDVSFLEMEAEPSCMENILPCKHSK